MNTTSTQCIARIFSLYLLNAVMHWPSNRYVHYANDMYKAGNIKPPFLLVCNCDIRKSIVYILQKRYTFNVPYFKIITSKVQMFRICYKLITEFSGNINFSLSFIFVRDAWSELQKVKIELMIFQKMLATFLATLLVRYYSYFHSFSFNYEFIQV